MNRDDDIDSGDGGDSNDDVMMILSKVTMTMHDDSDDIDDDNGGDNDNDDVMKIITAIMRRTVW